MSPQLLFYVAFTLYPIVMSYVYVLYDWNGIGPLNDFVGFANFKTILQDDLYWSSVKNSFIYIGGLIVLVLPSSLVLALILNSTLIKGKAFFRTVYFIPVVSVTAIIGVIMKLIFGNDNALFNNLLIELEILDQSYAWLQHPVSAMVILIVVGAWITFGMKMVYWLAALQTIPYDMYEAAKIDGAGFVNVFRYITLPLLLPSAAVILLLTIVSGFNVFDLAKTLTDGGPYFATTTVDLYIYNLVFADIAPRIGHASAAGIAFGLIVFIITSTLAYLGNKIRTRTEGKALTTGMQRRGIK